MKYLLFLIVLLCAACYHRETFTYRPFSILYEPSPDSVREDLRRKLLEDVHPTPQFTVALNSGWAFEAGSITEGLHEKYKAITRDSVNLPHLILMPDHALWYARVYQINEPGFLHIAADDGAQLFVNDTWVKRNMEGLFPVDSAGRATLTVRVLNNAMAGGLNAVHFLTQKNFNEYQILKSKYRRWQQVVKKILLSDKPLDISFTVADRDWRTARETFLNASERYFNDKPYFTGPWLIRKDTSVMSIMAEQDGDAPVTLRFGTDKGNLDKETIQQGSVLNFELDNIEQGQTWYYQLQSQKSTTAIYSFSNPASVDSFSFNIWGDSQSGWKYFQENIRNTLQYNDAFGIGVGDLVGNGSDEDEWRKFFQILAPSSSGRPYYLVPGNHDYDGYYDDLKPANYERYTSYMPKRYFSWYYGNAAFIALDPNENFPIGVREGSQQHAWFMKALNTVQWKKATWRFILLHQTLYSQGWQGYGGDQVLRDLIEPHIESAGIDFIVSGHTHDYERLKKKYGQQEVVFLIVGGAGGSLEPPESSLQPKMDTVIKKHHMGRFFIQGQSIRFEARGLQNEVLDTFTVASN
jgi:predicted phosphodiesterase